MAEGIKVNQEKRIIEVDIAVADFSKVEKYQNAGYTSILHDKSTRGKGVTKKELEIYLKGRISDSIYNEMKKKIDAKMNFLELKGWLKDALMKDAEERQKKDKNAKYIPADVIVKVAKKQAKEQTKSDVKEYIEEQAQAQQEKNSAAE